MTFSTHARVPPELARAAVDKLDEVEEARLRRKSGQISLLDFYHEVSAILDREPQF